MAHHLAERERQQDSGDDTSTDAESHGAEHDGEHMAALRAERDTDAELVGSLDDDVRNNAVEADSSQREREDSEGREQPGDQVTARPLGLAHDPVLEIVYVAGRLLVVIDRVHLELDSVEER